MPSQEQWTGPLFGINFPLEIVTPVLALAFATMSIVIPSAQAQTFTVLHTFTGGQDGATPKAGVTMDRAGNLYGTTYTGGGGYGTVYRLKRSGSNWLFGPLYSFSGGGDGANPSARVIFGSDGALYGTTEFGGTAGTVFKLQPAASACKTPLCLWTETVLHNFEAGADEPILAMVTSSLIRRITSTALRFRAVRLTTPVRLTS